jgi:hypothetical protein
MLNIGRMAPGRADYYLTAVARDHGRVEGDGDVVARGEAGHGPDFIHTLEVAVAVVPARSNSGGVDLDPVDNWPAGRPAPARVRT